MVTSTASNGVSSVPSERRDVSTPCVDDECEAPSPPPPPPARDDLLAPGRRIAVVSTAAPPWMTGTAVNPTLRAAFLARALGCERDEGDAAAASLRSPSSSPFPSSSSPFPSSSSQFPSSSSSSPSPSRPPRVTLVVPWLNKTDQGSLFPEGHLFDAPAQQEACLRSWVAARAGFVPQFDVLWYPARYDRTLLGVFPVGDLAARVRDELGGGARGRGSVGESGRRRGTRASVAGDGAPAATDDERRATEERPRRHRRPASAAALSTPASSAPLEARTSSSVDLSPPPAADADVGALSVDAPTTPASPLLDGIILEEPEHLTWHHTGCRWTSVAPWVVGVVHTNYRELGGRNAGPVMGALAGALARWLAASHCHALVRLSPATAKLPRQATACVHGVAPRFIEIGERVSEEMRHREGAWRGEGKRGEEERGEEERGKEERGEEERGEEERGEEERGEEERGEEVRGEEVRGGRANEDAPSPSSSQRQQHRRNRRSSFFPFTKGAYALGKIVWGKGWEELVDLMGQVREMEGGEQDETRDKPSLSVDAYGDGAALSAVVADAERLGASIDFTGHKTDHLDPRLLPYRAFVNASTSDVVATTSLEALAMGKWLVCARHACNEFASSFANCLTYDAGDAEGFARCLGRALAEDPRPLSPEEVEELGWAAATRRLGEAARKRASEAAAGGRGGVGGEEGAETAPLPTKQQHKRRHRHHHHHIHHHHHLHIVEGKGGKLREAEMTTSFTVDDEGAIGEGATTSATTSSIGKNRIISPARLSSAANALAEAAFARAYAALLSVEPLRVAVGAGSKTTEQHARAFATISPHDGITYSPPEGRDAQAGGGAGCEGGSKLGALFASAVAARPAVGGSFCCGSADFSDELSSSLRIEWGHKPSSYDWRWR